MASAVFTPGQLAFISRYAKDTGLNQQVVAAQVFNEMNNQSAAQRQAAGNHNWLNIGWTDSGQKGTGNKLWMDPLTAADASARWVKGEWDVPGFGRAAPGIQGILKSVGQGPAAQIAALQNSGWASSRYPNLPSVFQTVNGVKLPNVPAAGVPASSTPPPAAPPFQAPAAPAASMPQAPNITGAVLGSLGKGPGALLSSIMSAVTSAQAAPRVPVPSPTAPALPPAVPPTGAAVPSSTNVPVPGAGGKGRAGVAEAFYDPLGSWDNGRFGGAIGHHSDHVHISAATPATMLRAIRLAKHMGLAVRENPYVDPVDPVHVQGSYHYRTFPGKYGNKQLGEAIDVSGSADQMAAYYRAMTDSK